MNNYCFFTVALGIDFQGYGFILLRMNGIALFMMFLLQWLFILSALHCR